MLGNPGTIFRVALAGGALLAVSGAVAATTDELRAKAAALVAQMTVNEKCDQLRNDSPATASRSAPKRRTARSRSATMARAVPPSPS